MSLQSRVNEIDVLRFVPPGFPQAHRIAPVAAYGFLGVRLSSPDLWLRDPDDSSQGGSLRLTEIGRVG